MSDTFKITRRAFTGSALAGTTLGTAALAQQTNDPALYQQLKNENVSNAETGAVKRNISGFTNKDWRPYFSNTRNGVILVDTLSRALHFWSEDQSVYKLFPTSVPETPELTRTGRTKITRKRVGPDWRPTPNMLKRNPEWPNPTLVQVQRTLWGHTRFTLAGRIIGFMERMIRVKLDENHLMGALAFITNK